MLDWEGNMINKKDQIQLLLEEVHLDSYIVASATNSRVEFKAVHGILSYILPPFATCGQYRPL